MTLSCVGDDGLREKQSIAWPALSVLGRMQCTSFLPLHQPADNMQTRRCADRVNRHNHCYHGSRLLTRRPAVDGWCVMAPPPATLFLRIADPA